MKTLNINKTPNYYLITLEDGGRRRLSTRGARECGGVSVVGATGVRGWLSARVSVYAVLSVWVVCGQGVCEWAQTCAFIARHTSEIVIFQSRKPRDVSHFKKKSSNGSMLIYIYGNK